MTNDEAAHKYKLYAVEKMFSDKSFNICLIDTLTHYTVKLSHALDYDFLRLFHCVQWEDMPNGVADHVKKVALKLLKLTEKDVN